MFNVFIEFPKPIIAAVNGPGIGENLRLLWSLQKICTILLVTFTQEHIYEWFWWTQKPGSGTTAPALCDTILASSSATFLTPFARCKLYFNFDSASLMIFKSYDKIYELLILTLSFVCWWLWRSMKTNVSGLVLVLKAPPLSTLKGDQPGRT